MSQTEPHRNPWALGCLILLIVAWVAAWIVISARRAAEPTSDVEAFIEESVVLAAALGLIAILAFIGIYLAEQQDKMRSAIAGSFILVFLLMMIALPVVPQFLAGLISEAGSGLTEAEATADANAKFALAQQVGQFFAALFDTFKWVITAIIGFYFTGVAAENITDRVQRGRTERASRERSTPGSEGRHRVREEGGGPE